MNRLSILLPLFLFLLIAAGLGLGLAQKKGEEISRFAQHVGEPVPSMTLEGFDPAAWKGKAYVVNFFASWCAQCREEHAWLMTLRERGVPVIGIAYKDKPGATERLLDRDGNPYDAIAQDHEGRFGIEWGLTGVPETYVIDRNGTIRDHIVGPLTEETMEQRVLGLWEIMQ